MLFDACILCYRAVATTCYLVLSTVFDCCYSLLTCVFQQQFWYWCNSLVTLYFLLLDFVLCGVLSVAWWELSVKSANLVLDHTSGWWDLHVWKTPACMSQNHYSDLFLVQMEYFNLCFLISWTPHACYKITNWICFLRRLSNLIYMFPNLLLVSYYLRSS